MSEVHYQNKKLGKTLQNDNNTRQYDNNILQKFSKIRSSDIGRIASKETITKFNNSCYVVILFYDKF